MALMNSAVQGVAVSMSRYREDQILKRITTTPLSPLTFVLAEVLSRLVINIAQVFVVLGVGVYGFHANVGLAALWPLLGLSIVGAVLFQLIGFYVASVTRTVDAAQGMTQAITIPMLFLSGVFFPVDTLPKWLYSIVQFLPLAPLLRLMRVVALGGGSLFDNLFNPVLLIAWIVILLAIVGRRFRLTDG